MASILSVGIDIGTSTTQVIFSRIDVDNTAGYFTAPRIQIVGKQLVYKSPVHFTPLVSETMLDGAAVRDIVAAEFDSAGFRPADVDTGAVIITGESARKENAAIVLEKLSDFAGEFVVSTAGPDLESIVAGKGSGAYQYSIDNECTVLNLDIGGGTTNIVAFDCGTVVGKACFDIGGRLIKVDRTGSIDYISPSAARVAESLGIRLERGMRADEAVLARITDRMASLLAEAVGLIPKSALLASVKTSKSSDLPDVSGRIALCFSGGVAECYYREAGNDPFVFGDIGVLLGRSLRRESHFGDAKVISAGETIRATVVGAGTYTTSLSGSTITYSHGVFPVKNVPALTLNEEEQARCIGGDEALLTERCRWFLEQSDSETMLLAIPGLPDPTYEEVRTLAKCIVCSMEAVLPPDAPIIVVVRHDIAKALGIAMQQLTGRKIAAIDSVIVEVNDYVDIGRPLMDGLVVPVIVKTLLFG